MNLWERMATRHSPTLALLGLAALLAASTPAHALEWKFWEDYEPLVVVSDPFVELRTGPGRGYPIFYVVGEGDPVVVLKERTDWYKVRTPRGKEGWVHASQMSSTLDLQGGPIDFPAYGMEDFSFRRWEIGFAGGDFEGADALSAYGAFGLTPNISLRAEATQLLGDFSDGWMATGSIYMSPFPTWRISPFFGIGTGVIHIDPQTTVVQAEDRTDEIVHAGGGFNIYLSRRVFLRMEYRRHTVLTSRDDYEEIDEWKAGFSVFL